MKLERFAPLFVFVVALALRLLHSQQVVANDPFWDQPSVDSQVYVEWAKQLATGGHWLGNEAFFLSPLYGYLLGALYAVFGPGFVSPLVVNALLGAGTCTLTYLLGARLFDLRAGLVAAGLVCLYRMEIFYEGAPLLEPLQTFLCAAIGWAAVWALDAPGVSRFALVGALTGLAVLGRQNLLLFAAPFTVWLGVSRRWLGAATYAGVTALCIAPATLHNWLAAHDLVLVNSTGGIILYTGWNPEANGVYMVPSIFPRALADDPVEQKDAYRFVAEQRLHRAPLPASEVSSYWRGQAVDWVTANPGRALLLAFEKARLFWNAFEAWDVRSETLARPTSWLLRLPLCTFALLAPLAVAGIALSTASWRRLVPLYLLLLTHFATFVLFIALSRYRMPALSTLAVFAGVTPVALLDAVRAQRLGRAALAAAVFALVGLVVEADVPSENLTMAHFNLGNAYREKSQWQAAIAEYEHVIAVDPGYISVWNNLALVYERNGSARELQVETWQRVLQLARAQGSGLHVERATRHLAGLGVTMGP